MQPEEIVFQLASIYLDMTNIKIMFVGGSKDDCIVKHVDFDALYNDLKYKNRYSFGSVSRWDESFNDKMLSELAEEMNMNNGMLSRDITAEWDY